MKKRFRKKKKIKEFIQYALDFDYVVNNEDKFFDTIINCVESMNLWMGGTIVYHQTRAISIQESIKVVLCFQQMLVDEIISEFNYKVIDLNK